MNERKWHEWNSTFPQWKGKIVEIELVCSHFPSHMLKVSVLPLPPSFLPSSAPACLRFRSWGSEKKIEWPRSQAINYDHLLTCSEESMTCMCGVQTEKWCALQGPFSLAAWLLGFCLRWPWSSCGCMAHGPREQPCFAAQFPGIAQFSTRCLASFLAALHLSVAHCVSNVASRCHSLSHHTGE